MQGTRTISWVLQSTSEYFCIETVPCIEGNISLSSSHNSSTAHLTFCVQMLRYLLPYTLFGLWKKLPSVFGKKMEKLTSMKGNVFHSVTTYKWYRILGFFVLNINIFREILSTR